MHDLTWLISPTTLQTEIIFHGAVELTTHLLTLMFLRSGRLPETAQTQRIIFNMLKELGEIVGK